MKLRADECWHQAVSEALADLDLRFTQMFLARPGNVAAPFGPKRTNGQGSPQFAG
jgi:hypothetical protein